MQSLSTKVDELLGEKERLQVKITELEEEKGNLLLSLLDYDELQGSYPVFPQSGPLKLVGDSLCEKVSILRSCSNNCLLSLHFPKIGYHFMRVC